MLSRFLTVSQQRNHSVSVSERINLLIKALEIWWFSRDYEKKSVNKILL